MTAFNQTWPEGTRRSPLGGAVVSTRKINIANLVHASCLWWLCRGLRWTDCTEHRADLKTIHFSFRQTDRTITNVSFTAGVAAFIIYTRCENKPVIHTVWGRLWFNQFNLYVITESNLYPVTSSESSDSFCVYPLVKMWLIIEPQIRDHDKCEILENKMIKCLNQIISR